MLKHLNIYGLRVNFVPRFVTQQLPRMATLSWWEQKPYLPGPCVSWLQRVPNRSSLQLLLEKRMAPPGQSAPGGCVGPGVFDSSNQMLP